MNSLQAPNTAEDIQKKFPKVIQALGTLAGEYHIQLVFNAKSHALFTPWHVPLLLCPKAEEELEKMEKGRSDFKGIWAYPVVCGNGGHPQEVRKCLYLCRPQTT